jgi:hypothetical protein
MKIYLKLKGVSLAVTLALSALVTHGQVTVNTFLNSAGQATELESYANQINYLQTGQYRLSPIKGVELRTQNNQLGSGKQQYGFRINPANPWEVKYTNRVFQSQKAALVLEKELALKDQLAQRYELVNEVAYLNEMKTLREAMLQNTQYMVSSLEQQKASSFFDAEDYVGVKLNEMEDQIDSESFDFETAQKLKEFEILFSVKETALPQWTYGTIISLPQIEKLADSLMATPLFLTRLAYRQEKVKLADYEHALQKANINPGFIQTEYTPYRLAENKNTMGFSMGVNIPLFNPNKADMAEKKLDLLEAQSDLNLEKKEAEAEVKKLYGSLKHSLMRYKSLEQKLKAYQEKEILKSVNALTQNNPQISLKFNGQLLKLQKIQLQLKSEIYQTYINLLTASDLINQKPLINFLSNGLEPL